MTDGRPGVLGATQTAKPVPKRTLIVRGVIWNSLFQIFLVVVNFASMLVLVRLLPPAEFGKAAAVTGMVSLINCFNCSYFIAHAIQLREGEEPDWTAHWLVGNGVQLILFGVANGLAAVAWFLPVYTSVAPLLHLASIGLLIDCPTQMAMAILRREMAFRTLRTVHAVCVLLSVTTSIALAVVGTGAGALIFSSNVIHGMPFGVYLLAVRKWRPAQFWQRPDWGRYSASLKFGSQLSASAMLSATRGMLDSMILPGSLGYEAVGLLNRAQVLFTTTIGRVNTLVLDTVYPLLPRSANDPTQFARHATLFLQVMLLLTIPGAVFLAIDGPLLSRVLYGSRWSAADPLIAPATLFAWGLSALLLFTIVLQAYNRLERAVLGNFTAALLCIPAVFMAIYRHDTLAYAWTLALGQLLAATTVLITVGRYLQEGWPAKILLPPIICSAIASTVLLAVSFIHRLELSSALFVRAGLFGTVLAVSLRSLFPSALRAICSRIPGGQLISKLAGL